MKNFIMILVALSSLSAFANSEQNATDAKLKLVNAINSSVSFQISLNELNDNFLPIATYSDRFHAEISRNFGKACIVKSFGSVTELSHFLAIDDLSVDVLLFPILENCYKN